MLHLALFRAADADTALQRQGLKVKDGWLLVMNDSVFVSRIFADTPWANGWRATLARTPGAKRDMAARFKGLKMAKAVGLPLATIMDEE